MCWVRERVSMSDKRNIEEEIELSGSKKLNADEAQSLLDDGAVFGADASVSIALMADDDMGAVLKDTVQAKKRKKKTTSPQGLP
eukprot:8321094-Pyramimonas_sp.AAC.1